MIFIPIKAVFFDNNGTLEDDLHIAIGSKDEIFRAYGLDPPTDDQYRQEMTSDYMKFYYKYSMPLTVSADDVNKIRSGYYATHRSKALFRSDAKDTVIKCRELGLKTAIVSAETDVLNERLKEEDFFDSFDIVRTKAWPKKPALVETMEKLKLVPSSVLYVDDTVEGLQSAKSVGATPVGFTNLTAYSSEVRVRKVAKFCINNLSDLLPRLKRINGITFCQID